MNATVPPPLPGVHSQPKISAYAIWSFVLGILSLLGLACFAGIPGLICGHLALCDIRESNGRRSGQGFAMAGLVTSYISTTICVVGLLAAIIVPNYIKARETSMRNACINNLQMIDAAKDQWASEHQKQATDTPTESDLLPYFDNHQFPHCPAGGVYTIGRDFDPPACSITNHILPPD
jgi:hypothetical protein